MPRLTWAHIGHSQPPSAVNSRSQPENEQRRPAAFTQVRHRKLVGGGGERGGRVDPADRAPGAPPGHLLDLPDLSVRGLAALAGQPAADRGQAVVANVGPSHDGGEPVGVAGRRRAGYRVALPYGDVAGRHDAIADRRRNRSGRGRPWVRRPTWHPGCMDHSSRYLP
jgi:hypothetical protein